jgi:hypothetical protein
LRRYRFSCLSPATKLPDNLFAGNQLNGIGPQRRGGRWAEPLDVRRVAEPLSRGRVCGCMRRVRNCNRMMAATPSARGQRVKPGPQVTRPALWRLSVFKQFAAKSPDYRMKGMSCRAQPAVEAGGDTAAASDRLMQHVSCLLRLIGSRRRYCIVIVKAFSARRFCKT